MLCHGCRRSGHDGSQEDSGSWAELLDSPAGSSPRSLGTQPSPGSSAALPSPRACLLQRQQLQTEQQPPAVAPALLQDGQGQRNAAPLAAVQTGCVAAIQTSLPRGHALGSLEAGDAGAPDSPPMSAVLQAAGAGADLVEEGQLIVADSGVEEFLRNAAAEMG